LFAASHLEPPLVSTLRMVLHRNVFDCAPSLALDRAGRRSQLVWSKIGVAALVATNFCACSCAPHSIVKLSANLLPRQLNIGLEAAVLVLAVFAISVAFWRVACITGWLRTFFRIAARENALLRAATVSLLASSLMGANSSPVYAL
jgi:hypothetical protein